MPLREMTRGINAMVESLSGCLAVVSTGTAHVLMPITARKQLTELPDGALTKVKRILLPADCIDQKKFVL